MSGSRLLLLIAVVCFLVAFLEIVTGSKLGIASEGWVAAGLAFLAASGLV